MACNAPVKNAITAPEATINRTDPNAVAAM
jgi:hypothetical protein